jgi:hypothetical protein
VQIEGASLMCALVGLVEHLPSPTGRICAAHSHHDAFALAIQHFNAAHERAVNGWGPEHQFMIAVLEAVDSAEGPARPSLRVRVLREEGATLTPEERREIPGANC